MTFTFDSALSTDLAKVRFHVGDMNDQGHYLEDETINALVTSEGSVETAALACIRFIISQLATPNFKKDWLSVTNEKAREGYEQMLKSKAREFGISLGTLSLSATVSLPYRADSDQEDSDYDGD